MSERRVLNRVKRLPAELLTQNIVYILRSSSDSDKFYCGYTNNIARRIRQHNGFIKGGGEYTASIPGPWLLACIVYGIPELTKKEALNIEYYTKAKNYNHPLNNQIPEELISRRLWLVLQAMKFEAKECTAKIFDRDMKKLYRLST
jgi:structure-specific endonuclease subunit SLX1